MILMIDNYDSFTFNLVQYIKQLDFEVHVVRNDAITVEEIQHMQPTAIVLSPGPGTPNSAGICLEVVAKLHQQFPILGICLGHQTIAQAFGATIEKAKEPMHGKVSLITHDNRGMFHNLMNPLAVTRYHSLIVNKATIPACLKTSATTKDGVVMALRHKKYPIEGIQAHPEAILSECGIELLKNFFAMKDGLENEAT
ncbi:aminodeoxychorismate/anthranilate synthase component II [Virgibacillus pantothenticus]|uniref:Anthranilate synthase n=2 Tax=Virgibacillus pantothenticus TaxID=1473 RepID=A0A0L0QMU2_VIRPA|nr:MULTISPECIES: aminodeoxychorismate/anthranilate synthase component II [Virgibacillus]API93650.1 aminodeoxychorismate/anthranilate synthase component II [Virgibacillus sp. 6R]KNE19940.1 anthranilate synthase [Virgibacillus pantothenticus]MBS7429956.1 aminodeoxychorismate/anthranilate synthase component II [Virgibacillus sp. 19R1-5]MBU8564946.1 aminodeoxychorismate/anthranilate synthase component II [Virgibacillus pantothenticus]MBU8599254.1 aminodeoxychorismate/anthranilate synthase componen